MSRSNLKPIVRQHFGQVKPAGTAHPVPSAKALHTRRMNERLQAATSDMPMRNSTTREPYTGGELMACVRPGAMDAFKLPSVQMGQLVYRKEAQQ